MARTKARKIERVGDLSSARLQTFNLCSQLMDSTDCPNLTDPKTSRICTYVHSFFFLLSRQNLTSPIRNVLSEYFVYVIVTMVTITPLYTLSTTRAGAVIKLSSSSGMSADPRHSQFTNHKSLTAPLGCYI